VPEWFRWSRVSRSGRAANITTSTPTTWRRRSPQGSKDRLLYLTESGGVWDAEKNLLPVVKAGEIAGLIRREIVRDGMIPKLRSCARTLRQTVGEIDILSPATPKAWCDGYLSRLVGTRL
jgi:acetylglutamate kinase